MLCICIDLVLMLISLQYMVYKKTRPLEINLLLMSMIVNPMMHCALIV